MAEFNWGALQKEADEAFRPLPVGKYMVTVEKSEATKASTGKDMIKVTFKVSEGPEAGKLLFHQMVFAPDSQFALFRWFKHFDALGYTREDFTRDNPTMDRLALVIRNRRALATVEHEEYQGVTRARVKDLESPSAGGATSFGGGAVAASLGAPKLAAPVATLSAPAASPVASPAPQEEQTPESTPEEPAAAEPTMATPASTKPATPFDL